jgi:hypothetical protein
MKTEYLPGEVKVLHFDGLRLKMDDIVVYDHLNSSNKQYPAFKRMLFNHYELEEFGGDGPRDVSIFKIISVIS